MDIRPTAPSLAPLLARLHAESFGAEAWNLEQMRGSLALGTTQGWVAYEDEMPTGFVLYQATMREIEILTLCVSPSQRRQKIGESLMRYVIAAARKYGAERILLEVAVDNDAALGLYNRLNFREIGIRPAYYRRFGHTADAVMLEFIVPSF